MSVTIFCQAHLNFEEQEISVDQIRGCFQPFIESENEFGFEVKYDPFNSSFIFIDTCESMTSGFSISKPCSDKRLFESIYKAMQLGNFIWFTDGDAFFVSSNQTLSHIPKEMKELVLSEEVELRVVATMEQYLEYN